ncbi:MAG: glycosyltransferase family 1 protein [Chloroflexota bacterium]
MASDIMDSMLARQQPHRAIKVLLDAHQLGRRQTGNETYVRELVKCLRERRDLQMLAAVEHDHDLEGLLPAGLGRRVPRSGLGRLFALSRMARRERVDVLHAIYFLPPLIGRPSVLTVHDISFELHPEFFSRGALARDRLLIRASARRATCVITGSNATRIDLVEHYGLPESRIVVAPYGVSATFHLDEDAIWAPYAGNRPLRVLAVGALQPRKNLVRLIDAIALVRRRFPVELRVVGPDGHDAGAIRKRMSESVDTRMTGWLSEEDLATEYRAADIFAYPSIYEGFGLPVLEAMACGTPVVTSTGGSLPEVAGDAALLVDPLDVEALSAAILRVAEESVLAQSLRDRGIERAAQFTWQRSADVHVAAYRDLVNR